MVCCMLRTVHDVDRDVNTQWAVATRMRWLVGCLMGVAAALLQASTICVCVWGGGG